MPTTITSAGITFNDATTLTSAVIPANAVGATQIANGSVTAAKLGTTEQTRIAKAWVNFNGTLTGLYSATGVSYSRSGTTVTVTSPNHGLTTGYTITVSSATDSGLNGATGTVTNTGTNTFTFVTSSTGTSTGTLNWVLNGSIRSSYNVSSVTKNGTGDYTVNFTTPMADANYTAVASVSSDLVSSTVVFFNGNSSVFTVNSVRISTVGNIGATPANSDRSVVCISIFGN